MQVHLLSCVELCTTPLAIFHQAPLSMGRTRQEHWSGLPLTAPGDLPDLWIEPASPAAPALAGRFFTAKPPGKTATKDG